MKAVIMAGGSGTRLLPLTENMPKPLAPLCTKPICCYILDLLKTHGCTEAVFTLMYKGDMIESFFDGMDYCGIKLGFSYEDAPLGTAGCVKKAAASFTEPFVVISGDALCDFNLTAAMKYHKDNNAAATIITKKTDDPREFGIVTEQGGKVTGFIEKPSFIGCTEDKANTGVYILSPEALDIIPDGFADFACDIFPLMQERKMPLYAYEECGYWCDIGDLKAYKRCQRDILEGKVKVKLPARRLTEGGYCDSGTGSYQNLRPPYYIGKNVTIGGNTVIRDGSVIGDNVTVGNDCTIDGAIVSDGAFIGDNTRLNDCIICRDVSVKRDSAVYENAVIGDSATLGRGCIVMPDIKIWSNKQTEDNITLSSDIEHDAHGLFRLDENGFTGETNITATPQIMARLGSALAAATDKSICVGNRADSRSRTFAKSLIAGINAAGRDCLDCRGIPLSMLIHKGRLTDSGLIVHVSVSARTSVTVLSSGGMPITRKQERTIEGIMNRGGAPKASYDAFGKCTEFDDGGAVYTAMLSRCADFKTEYSIQLDCNNRFIKECAAPIFEKISDKNGKRMIISVDYSGTKAEIFTAETDIVNMEKLLLISFCDLAQKGIDIALPNNILFDMEQLSKPYKGKVYRYYACSNDNSDSTARKIGEAQPFITDGCVLALSALKAAADRNISFAELCASLPCYVKEKRYIPLHGISAPSMLKALCADGTGTGEGVMISSDKSKVLIRSGRAGTGLYLFAQSLSAETAKELCDLTERKIEEITAESEKQRRK